MLVRDVMSPSLVTVSVDASLSDAVGALLANDVGSVVVLADGEPAGLVTETDALEAARASDRPLSAIGLDQFCDGPIQTTSPDRTVQAVARRMAEEQVKKFPVRTDLDLVGIVTLTDIVYHLSDIRSEAQQLAERHYDWSA